MGNSANGILNGTTGATIDAQNKWWGNASGPGPVGPGSGDNVSVNIDYDPWLQAEKLMYWKDYNEPEVHGGYMPDIDQNQDFDKKAIALDFDDDDAGIETMPGWTSFTIAAYSPSTGYGWDNTLSIDDRNRGSGTLLQRDFHFSRYDRTFKVDLANGSYDVKVYVGDATAAHDNVDITVEGITQNVSTVAGEFKEVLFSSTVSDGQLTISLHDAGGTDPNWVVNGIEITGIESHYCAPVAEANSLWWLDKKYDLGLFDTVTHTEYVTDVNEDGSNDILDLVQELALLMDTNVGQTGTTVEGEQHGIDVFLANHQLTNKLYEHTVWDSDFPDPQVGWMQFFSYLEEEVERSQDVKLDLGFWHVDSAIPAGPGLWQVTWSRRGGHAVTVAGVDSPNFLFAVSDPDNDAAEAGLNPGVVRTPDGYTHPYPHARCSSQ